MPRPRSPKSKVDDSAVENKPEIAEPETSTARRQPDQIIFPLHYALNTIFVATGGGVFLAQQIAVIWNETRSVMKSMFSDYPDGDISPDTIYRIISFIGRMEAEDLINFFGSAMMVKGPDADSDLYKQFPPPPLPVEELMPTYIVNCLDTADGLTLRQQSIKTRKGRKRHNTEFIEQLDLRGGIVTADILNTEKDLAELLIDSECDYCLALKDSGGPVAARINAIFDHASEIKKMARMFGYPIWVSTRDEILDLGPDVIATRNTRVVPAVLLINKGDRDFIYEWEGLEAGCAAVVTDEITDKKTARTTVAARYFISSLNFDAEYSAARISQLVREHWQNNDKLHWELDLTFSQDRTRCANADYIKGIAVLHEFVDSVTAHTELTEYEDFLK